MSFKEQICHHCYIKFYMQTEKKKNLKYNVQPVATNYTKLIKLQQKNKLKSKK